MFSLVRRLALGCHCWIAARSQMRLVVVVEEEDERLSVQMEK